MSELGTVVGMVPVGDGVRLIRGSESPLRDSARRMRRRAMRAMYQSVFRRRR